MLSFLPCIAAGQTKPVHAEGAYFEPAMRSSPSTPLPAPNVGSALVRHSVAESGGQPHKVIVIGFVGGFARGNDQKHPEVQFAEFLRDRYGTAIFAEVFANHQGREALHTILQLLRRDEGSPASAVEREKPRIILYGHSWGAAETLIFARQMGKMGIPVFLTIQVDSIAKPGHDDSRIPANVTNAVNLYQSRGPLHGQTEILAAEPAHTKIIGNLHMTYTGRSINCDNYPWFARTFNRPHHEIENDPRVWDLAVSLIDSAFEASGLTDWGSMSSAQPFVSPLHDSPFHISQ
jgi:hypothetical protein